MTSSQDGDLHQAWYDAVVEAFGLSPLTFRLARLLTPLGSTSGELWDCFDAIPAESDGRFFEPEFLNRFSDDYGEVVNLIVPQAGTAWREAMGESYGQWAAYLSSCPPIPPGGMLDLFSAWTSQNLPDPARAQAAITAYGQILNGIVPVAQDRFLQAAGVYAYSRTMGEARTLAAQGPACSFSFSSSPPAPARGRPPWPPPLPDAASAAARRLTAALPDPTRGPAALAMTTLAAGHVEGQASFAHRAQVCAAPLETDTSLDGVPYPAWFSAAALSYAHQNRDATVWPADMKPTWDQTFGPSGNLRRWVTSLMLVDGVDVSLASDADLAADDRDALQQAVDAGATPLFALPAPTAMKASGRPPWPGPRWRCSLAAPDEPFEIHISSPPGDPLLFGVVFASLE